MKKMAVAADLPSSKRFTNTRVRKTLVQTMTDNCFPDNLQVYVTGHKNTQSLNNYRTLNDTHKPAISQMLSRVNPNPRPLPSASLSRSPSLPALQNVEVERTSRWSPSFNFSNVARGFNELSQSTIRSQSGQYRQDSLFAGSTIRNSNITVIVNYHYNTSIQNKRRRVIL